jgi:hypothetical protein
VLNFEDLMNLNLNAGIVFNIFNIKNVCALFVIEESEFFPVCNASIETVRLDMEKRLTEDSS